MFFIKNDLNTGVTDPIQSSRSAKSKFVHTSYPQKYVQYPHITIKLTNYSASSSGMQTTTMDVLIFVEVRIWARNQKEKDELANDCYKRLRDVQFTSGGSRENYLYDYKMLSAVEVDEDGEDQPKSRILNIQYKFFNA